ncbi:hypothetical protein T4D_11351 [Trichinella pseudospiralis]|uniref:Uncharacterized protein n=1 Tax=Trichinella pseudospiralis TaxID=6337 RepID=A0A0V1FVB8_TRIPS|nr:hypothetical protein T4D_6811 [Trichinella pseudospiralis]KRY89922.1 hypothetical protein T4D_11351 [Trichinella pseudospiralis]
MDRANGIFPPENEEEELSYLEVDRGVRPVRERELRSCDIVVGLCLGLLNKVYTHCCCSVVARPSLKREAERRGQDAANTGPSTNSEGRANSLAEETDEPAPSWSSKSRPSIPPRSIRHERTIPEMMNQTLVEKARAMLMDFNMSADL